MGGPDGSASNLPLKRLADRTKFLKEKLDAFGVGGAGATEFSGNMNTLTANGIFFITNTATNKPETLAVDGAMCFVMESPKNGTTDPKAVRQLWIGTKVYYRLLTLALSPSVGPWVKLQDDTTVGSVAAFAANTPPAGWLKANGATVSRTTYADLFARIGVTFGAGNGTTTFTLPDMRGEFIRGWDDGRGVDAARIFGSAQGDEFRTHHHSLQKVNSGGGGDPANDGYDLGNINSNGTLGVPSLVNVADFGGNETRPRNIALLYCIKY